MEECSKYKTLILALSTIGLTSIALFVYQRSIVTLAEQREISVASKSETSVFRGKIESISSEQVVISAGEKNQVYFKNQFNSDAKAALQNMRVGDTVVVYHGLDEEYLGIKKSSKIDQAGKVPSNGSLEKERLEGVRKSIDDRAFYGS